MSQSFATGVDQTAPRLVFAGDADDEMARWDDVRRAAMHWIPATRGGQGGRWERYGLGLDHEAITPEEGEWEGKGKVGTESSVTGWNSQLAANSDGQAGWGYG